MPSHTHRADRHAVAAWIPLAQWLALRAGAALLGCTVSDLVAWCIDRHAAEVIREEAKRREDYARRLVARNNKGGPTQC